MQPYRFERSFDADTKIDNSSGNLEEQQKQVIQAQKKIQDSFQQGFAEGFEKGLQKRSAERDDHIAKTLDKLHESVTLLLQKTAAFHRGVSQTAVTMVVEALRVLFPSLKADKNLMAKDIVQAVLPLLETVEAESINVYVHSSLTDFLSIHLSTLGSPVNFTLKVDNSLQPGDCRVRFDQGALEHIKERIMKELMHLYKGCSYPQMTGNISLLPESTVMSEETMNPEEEISSLSEEETKADDQKNEGMGAETKDPFFSKILYDIPVKITAVLGSIEMSVEQLVHLGRGAVIQLGKPVGDSVDIMVNDRLIARGEVVIIDGTLV